LRFPRSPAVYVCGGTTILHDRAERARQGEFSSVVSRIAFAIDRAVRQRSERAAFLRADAVVFDSAATRSAAITAYGIPPTRSHAVPGAIDPAEFFPPGPERRDAARATRGIR